MTKLSSKARKQLKPTSFVFPGERRFPIEDANHARNALARAAQSGSPSEKAKVRAAVRRKYPGVGVEGAEGKRRADRPGRRKG